MKKILIVITKGEVGGAQEVVRHLAYGLQDAGYEVTVGYGTGSYLEKELAPHHIKIVRFKHLRRTRNPLANLLFRGEIKRFLNAHPYNIVHIHSSNALMAAWGVKKCNHPPKTVFTFHGLSFLSPAHGNRSVRLIYKTLFKFLMRFVDVPVAVCEADATSIKNMFGKGVVIPNGVEMPMYHSRTEARNMISKKIDVNLDTVSIVGSIGRLAYPKNYEFLIQNAPAVIQKHPNTVFILIGEGPEHKKYEQLIHALKLERSCFLVGEISHAATLIPAFDVFTLTSLYEGSPITIIEALGASVPLLAPRVGGIPDLIAHDDDQLYTTHHHQEYQQKLETLLENQLLREEKSKQNKKQYSMFSTKSMVKNYKELYETKSV